MAKTLPRESRAAELATVVHPLFDVPEPKRDPAGLGPMRMSRGVKAALMLLRLYLLAMVALVAYRVLQLGGAFK